MCNHLLLQHRYNYKACTIFNLTIEYRFTVLFLFVVFLRVEKIKCENKINDFAADSMPKIEKDCMHACGASSGYTVFAVFIS